MDTLLQEALTILKKIERQGSTAQKIAKRCKIILTHQKRKHAELVAQSLGCHSCTVSKWVNRWKKGLPGILDQWQEENFNREKAILDILQDKPRSGAPPKFTTVQVTLITALACRIPEEFNRPITHWTNRELADEAAQQGIVKKVSETSVRRFLK